MAADPTESEAPETFEPDEQDDSPASEEFGSFESEEDDAGERYAGVTEANEADLAEQARVVSLDEDDYR